MQITDYIVYSGWIIAGGLAFYGIWDKATKARHENADQVANNLIQNLQTTTQLQEKKIKEMSVREIEQGKEIAHLQGQVKVLSDILQGRDPAMQAFLTSAPELIKIARENNGLAKENSKATTALTKAITDLVKEIKPQKIKKAKVVSK